MTIEKDPQAKLDYAVDWSTWLQAGETITASTWTVPAGIDQITPDPSFANGVATIWLGGGTVGTRYDIVNHIVTSQGREDDRTLTILVAER
jgi:hypothetical protein